jgi:hypothetical protein
MTIGRVGYLSGVVLVSSDSGYLVSRLLENGGFIIGVLELFRHFLVGVGAALVL